MLGGLLLDRWLCDSLSGRRRLSVLELLLRMLSPWRWMGNMIMIVVQGWWRSIILKFSDIEGLFVGRSVCQDQMTGQQRRSLLVLLRLMALWRWSSRVKRRQCIGCWSCLLVLLVIHTRGRCVLRLRTLNMQRINWSLGCRMRANYLSWHGLRRLYSSTRYTRLGWCISSQFLVCQLLLLSITFLDSPFWGRLSSC